MGSATVLAESAHRLNAPYGETKPTSALDFGVTRESRVSMRVVRGLVELVEQTGLSRYEFLRAAHLEPAQLDSPVAYASRSEVYRLCELAMELTHDQGLGLHWSERLSGTTFNPISQLIVHSANLRQGLESLGQFLRLLSETPSYQVVEQGDKVTIRCAQTSRESLPLQRFCGEMLIIGFVRLIRAFAPQAEPLWVGFEYEAPSYQDEYARVFGASTSVRFGQSYTSIVFDRAVLDQPSPHRDEDMHGALRVVAERRISSVLQREPFARRVRDQLVQQGATQADMPAVARALRLSVRSLRRRLSAEGRSYSAVAHEARAIVAKHMLRDSRRTIQETAYEMGFADTSTFHRAFKRWTGMTPNEFRDKEEEAKGGQRS